MSLWRWVIVNVGQRAKKTIYGEVRSASTEPQRQGRGIGLSPAPQT